MDVIALGDIDGDCQNEIILGSGNPKRLISVYRFLEDEYKLIYQAQADSAVPGVFDNISLGDIDGDKDMEIIGSGNTKRIEVFDLAGPPMK